MSLRPSSFILSFLILLASVVAAAAPQIEVEGLMPPNAAVVTIDGERKMLKVGQTFKGVTLISVYSRTAALEVDGNETVVGLSRKVGANYQAPVEQIVTIPINPALQYRTAAMINGRQAEVLVDTGANVIAMNLGEARRLGVRAEDGTPTQVETASGNVRAYLVKLNAVTVGNIKVNNVEAAVLEGDKPSTVLLGMTWLRHVKIEEKQGVMTLTKGP
ncbi:TIGR02281 family clan AA aspartic protease [Halioglobus maricola]|uniref:TIGR02281 family clan AA aspartic protease n=1 Tax=Halioglobus maricola TaxID=2601894 RepID=A0A5P9NGK0_9GAMM|nr:TIGR02281 family clan AA aspartic protease [Halioglobus maricola]QFU74676.1 TIGR02281 family clan AA aspartic protease [Halioglobus maricola]